MTGLAIPKRQTLASRIQKPFLAVVASVVAVGTGLAMVASAVEPATVVVSPGDTQGWTTTTASGGTVDYVTAADAPLGSGAVQFTTDATNESRTRISHDADALLANTTALSYNTKQVAVPEAAEGYAAPALRLEIDTTGDGVADDQLVYEPYYNAVVTSDWQEWNALEGKFWSANSLMYNGLGGVNAGSYASNFTIADVLADHEDAKIVGINLGTGTWNPSWQVQVDELVFNETTYNFEAGAVAATTKDQCKNGGWMNFQTSYKNQGQCVAAAVSSQNSRHHR